MQNGFLQFDDRKSQTRGAHWLRDSARALVALALFFAVVLLLSSLKGIPQTTHAYLGSLPLALAGVGYALLQIALRPARATLLKRLLLAATFVGWAVDQVLPAGRAATFLGDMVIAAYVLDLYWIALDQTSPDLAGPPSASQLEMAAVPSASLGGGSCRCQCHEKPASQAFRASL